ncbi:hypothetical protein AR457_38120 [Streptomyces agglomeratus]|uniref:DUF6507 family protein n=1 Tax=Streptomyces agglomeratus TaxID=285458 RepID=UPI0008524E6D|nr:DUF6507 family protein [Streptomyces agglomeratus]OEJ23021.1 hypothetical protein AR457_38120 [Streptomyces agglomeratus]OEJ36842.1 hypothetical protein BGK70_00235 [Streptomyces agglomeratus]
MASWDIQPQGVQGQLKVTGTHAGDLEKALTKLITDMSEAAQAAGTAVPGSQPGSGVPLGPVAPRQPSPYQAPQKATGPVAAALGEYLKVRQKDFGAMADRIQAAVMGAAKATNEYIEGDLEAAGQAQNAARSVRLDLLKDAGGNK